PPRPASGFARDHVAAARRRDDVLAQIIEHPGQVDAERLLGSSTFNPRDASLSQAARDRIANLIAAAAPATAARERELAETSKREAETARALGRAVTVDLRRRDASRLDLLRLARSTRFVTLGGETLALRAE